MGGVRSWKGSYTFLPRIEFHKLYADGENGSLQIVSQTINSNYSIDSKLSSHIYKARLFQNLPFYLYNENVDQGNGSYTSIANVSRALKNVREWTRFYSEKFARVAVRHGLFHFVRHNGHSLDAKVNEFSLAIKKEEQACEISAYGGKLKAPKVLADIVEPVAAAVYVDAKFDLKFIWEVFSPLLEPIVALENLQQPLTMLYELMSKSRGKNVDIKHWRNGENNITNILVDGKLLASACSEQKETSKLSAAKAALEKMLISKSMLILANDSCELLKGVESYGILYKEDHIVMFPIKFVYYVDRFKDQVEERNLTDLATTKLTGSFLKWLPHLLRFGAHNSYTKLSKIFSTGKRRPHERQRNSDFGNKDTHT
ncbi:hypothetical protein IFM89_012491 [Coptis chinensis]|uniref:Uncharacterized protein n=1 Tax=Coptis chinensis TaxID=261450 RepID=A0A835I206_9MAGN|nr:hypothetical protein IFM89_012491 [Coptis chinensis]